MIGLSWYTLDKVNDPIIEITYFIITLNNDILNLKYIKLSILYRIIYNI